MDAATHEEFDPHRRRRWRRTVAYVGLLVIAVAILALIPPLVNVNRYQRRITTTLSASLGRPVHLDSVTLHLLPFPGLTLTNFVVSEDPAFGAEPTIRANAVEAHLRLSSLWRRHIEISNVRFVDPSLNLVRNPEGRWNLDSVLVHAARIDAAPTEQRSASAAPRFPYIEATGARVNIKLGDEKMPFALTEADFALWLPSAQQWRIRLAGKPARTDTNIADPGTLRIEGALQHAGKLELVPVDLSASWHDAPLGEATRLMTGSDMGWRGTMNIDATLQGPLGAAAVKGKITLDGLRRTDFVPQEPLTLAAQCTATANAALAQLTNATCAIPVTGAQPLTVSSTSIDLGNAFNSPVALDATDLPLPWLYTWFKVLSPRVPPLASPAGQFTAHLVRSAPQAWSGDARLQLPAPAARRPTTASPQPVTFAWTVAPSSTFTGCPQALISPATPATLPSGEPVALASEVSPCGYGLHMSGTGSESDLNQAAQTLPQLSEGIHSALPPTATTEPAHFDLTCTRTWGDAQACTTVRPAVSTHKQARRSNRR